VFGALEVIGRVHASGDLVARDLTRLLALRARDYKALAATHADFAYWVMRAMAQTQAGAA
jgi:hypothetical protein